MNTLLALDQAVRRFGPAVLTDPAGLRDALRATTEPPPEPAITALTQAAATPALAWMRVALDSTQDLGHALAAGVDATRSHGHDLPAGPAAARWACIMLGAAAGVLPRGWARRDAPRSSAHQAARWWARRRRSRADGCPDRCEIDGIALRRSETSISERSTPLLRARYCAHMQMERVTLTLPADLVAAARDAVDQGTSESIDGYVAEAMSARRLRERSLAVLADLYGGPPPPDELEQARRSLLPRAAV